VLKKAGIVVATVAAGLLAVSPLAFAGDYKGDDNKKSHHKSHKKKAAKNEGSCNPDNTVEGKGGGILSGNAIQAVQIQDLICNTNALNDLVSVISPHKNEYNQG